MFQHVAHMFACGQVAPPLATSWLWTGAKIASASGDPHRYILKTWIKLECFDGNLRSVAHGIYLAVPKKNIFGPATKTALSNPLHFFGEFTVYRCCFCWQPWLYLHRWNNLPSKRPRSKHHHLGIGIWLQAMLPRVVVEIAETTMVFHFRWQSLIPGHLAKHLGEKGIFLDFNWVSSRQIWNTSDLFYIIKCPIVLSKLSPSELWTLKSHDNRVHTAICERMDLREFALFPHPQRADFASSLGPGHALLFDLLPGWSLWGGLSLPMRSQWILCEIINGPEFFPNGPKQ